MRLTAFIAGLFAVALIFISLSPTASAQEADNRESRKKIKIKSGDNLIKLAEQHETTYLRLFYANDDIEHPDIIYAGDQLEIPNEDEELKERQIPEDATQAQAEVQVQKQRQTGERQAFAIPADAGVWDRLAQCESGGNWSINTGNGYYGGLQFSQSSWQAVGGSGLPHQASKAEQIARGKMLQARQGWGAWPACSAKLGLR